MATFQQTRRTFLKISSLATAGLTLPFSCNPIAKTSRFGLITDSHYADREPNGTRYYRESLEKMKDCIDIMNMQQVDFVMHLGDFKDEDQNKKEADTLSYLKAIESEYAKFQGPRYHCVGNHDVDSIRKAQFLENVENTGIPKDQSYYSFDSGDLHYVVLDANYHKDGRDQFYAEGADWQDPNIPLPQLEWLRKDLEKSQNPTVVFCHHPLFDYPSESNLSVNNYKEVQNILEASLQVIAVFQGHVHEEHYEQVGNIHYSTQYGMVDYSGIQNNSFSIVRVDESGIEIDGYMRVTDQLYYSSL